MVLFLACLFLLATLLVSRRNRRLQDMGLLLGAVGVIELWILIRTMVPH